MISLRYHVVSIAAVFLALALGVVLGASGLSDRLLSAVAGQRDDLGQQVDQLTAQQATLQTALRSADGFAGAVGPLAVRGTLDGRSVVLVSAANADQGDRDAVTTLIKQAGGTLTGELALTDAVTNPARADQLRDLTSRLLPSGAQLPSAADPGSLAGGLLGSIVLLKDGKAQAAPAQAAAAIAGLVQGGFVRAGGQVQPGSLVLVLTGGALSGQDASDGAAVLARMSGELDRAGGGAVLAGRAGSAEPTGGVGVVRADTTANAGLSTVDDVQTAAGRVATVLALREQADGRAGRYGVASNAQAPVPGSTSG